MAETLVIDEAWTKTPADHLGAYQGTFVYISRDATKCATDAYVAAVHAQGKGVGFVFEDDAGRWRGGASYGLADGQFANTWADTHGLPADLPLYAAVDQQIVSEAEMLTALAYIEAFASVKRPGRGYGDYALVERLAAAGIGHDWQTVAWSGLYVSSHAAVFQRNFHTAPTVPGSYDEDVILGSLADAGLWLATPIVPPIPAPPVPVSDTHSKDDDEVTLIEVRSDGAYFAIPADLSHKQHVTDVPTLEKLQADKVHYCTIGLSDTQITAIPDAK